MYGQMVSTGFRMANRTFSIASNAYIHQLHPDDEGITANRHTFVQSIS